MRVPKTVGGKHYKECLVYGQPSINVFIIIVTVIIISLYFLTGEEYEDAAKVWVHACQPGSWCQKGQKENPMFKDEMKFLGAPYEISSLLVSWWFVCGMFPLFWEPWGPIVQDTPSAHLTKLLETTSTSSIYFIKLIGCQQKKFTVLAQ